EKSDGDSIEEPRFLRQEFMVKEGLKTAVIYHFTDDSGVVHLDGTALPSNRKIEPGRRIQAFEVTDLLTPGPHAIGVRAINHGGPRGTILRLNLIYEDGSETDVFSDESWGALKEEQPGWCKVGFTGETQEPVCFGMGAIPPWGTLIDTDFFYSADALATLKKAKCERDARIAALAEKIAQEPREASRVVYKNGLPVIQIGEKDYSPMIYMSHFWQGYDSNPDFVKNVEHFRDAGIHLYGLGVEVADVWSGYDKFDFSLATEKIARMLDLDPDARILFCIGAYQAPKWWVMDNQDELVRYANAEVNFSENDTNSNCAQPSYASEIWCTEFSDCVRRLIEYLEASPYASRIFGYRIDSGVYLEWHYYGMGGFEPDVSEPMSRAFRKWLTEKYGTDEALQTAWDDPTATLVSAHMPGQAMREHNGAGSIRDPKLDRAAVDSLRCMADCLTDLMLRVDHIAKEASHRKALVGNFCGYFFGMNFPAEGWHLENRRILASPDVDFQAQPPCYDKRFRDFGEGQPTRSLAESYRAHGKLNLIEWDTRTHVIVERRYSYGWTPADSVNLLARDFSQSLIRGTGFWYFDFGQGWYEDPLIGEYLKKLQPIRENAADCSSIAQVALVGDLESVYYHGVEKINATITSAINGTLHAATHAGAPFDAIVSTDLGMETLPDYKAYIFLNLCYATPEHRAIVERLRKAGKTLVWLYAPGYLTAQGADLDSLEEFTGMKITVIDDDGKAPPNGLHPIFKPTDATPFHNGYRKQLADGSVSYYFPDGILTADTLRDLLRTEGVFIYGGDANTALYANGSYLCFTTSKAGRRVIRFPQQVRLLQLFPERKEVDGLGDSFTFDAAENTTYLFQYFKE
ncbi:MAG: beta-galactosidase, partial [Victivallales bacterium]|nr:beta-galactosidase [Victivallales bacterium]